MERRTIKYLIRDFAWACTAPQALEHDDMNRSFDFHHLVMMH